MQQEDFKPREVAAGQLSATLEARKASGIELKGSLSNNGRTSSLGIQDIAANAATLVTRRDKQLVFASDEQLQKALESPLPIVGNLPVTLLGVYEQADMRNASTTVKRKSDGQAIKIETGEKVAQTGFYARFRTHDGQERKAFIDPSNTTLIGWLDTLDRTKVHNVAGQLIPVGESNYPWFKLTGEATKAASNPENATGIPAAQPAANPITAAVTSGNPDDYQP